MTSIPGVLYHGSHIGHGFVPFSLVPSGQQCSICRAVYYAPEASWYRCCEANCDWVLCHKCFEVKEFPFEQVQVVIRNPLTSHYDLSGAVHTRPRLSSYRLAPLYPGRLMEVVSSAAGVEDPMQTFFRLRSGGWINAADVVCVIPADDRIEGLAEVHLKGAAARLSGQTLSIANVMPPAALISYLQESTSLMDKNPPYGMVMAALTIYPTLLYVGTSRSALATHFGTCAEDELPEMLVGVEAASRGREYRVPVSPTCAKLTSVIIGFLHFVVLFTLSELEFSLDEEESLQEGTMLPLFGEVLANCLLIAQDINRQWQVTLPEEFRPLILRATVVLGRIRALLRYDEGPTDVQPLGGPAVVATHVDLPAERSRMRHLSGAMIDVAGRLLLRGVAGPPCTLKALLPLRTQLSFAPNEVLEKVFCELVTAAMEAAPAAQHQFLDVDPLEIVVRLTKTSSLAESQVSVFRLTGTAAHASPHNIALLTAVVLPSLMRMAEMPRSPAALTASLDCFGELAYNNPRVLDSSARDYGSTPPRRTAGVGTPCVATSAVVDGGTCSQLLHPNCGAFQELHLLTLRSGLTVALCASCAACHPPSEAAAHHKPGADARAPASFAYFRCQCVCCRHRTTSTRSLPPPAVPLTSAISAMRNAGLPRRMLQYIKCYSDSTAVLNAIGRLALRIEMPAEVMAALFLAVVRQANLVACAAAAQAIAAYAYLPCFEALFIEHACTPLVRYIGAPYEEPTPIKTFHEQTPGSSNVKNDNGLSPSPDVASTYRSSTSELHRELMYAGRHFHPVMDLFTSATSDTI